MRETIAIFAGKFDPMTRGHVDIATRAAALFAEVHVLAHAGAKSLFSAEERLALAEAELAGLENVKVGTFGGLLVDRAKALGATVLVRGMRGSHDWDHEMQMAFANRDLMPELETVFLAPSDGTTMISGSLVREVTRLGGDPSSWVSPAVAEALRAKFA